MESLRIRLVFEDRHILSKSQRLDGFKRSWVLLKPDQHPKISDLSTHLHQVFDLQQSCPNGILLSMDDFVLPPFEFTCLLKDKDIISVKKRGDTLSDIVKVGDTDDPAEELAIVLKQPVNSGTPLLANEEFEKEAGVYQSESEEDEEEKEDTSFGKSLGGNVLSRKRKASTKLQSSKKKKHCLVEPDDIENDDHAEQMNNHNDGVLMTKSTCKEKTTSVKRKQNIDSTTGSAGRSNSNVEPVPSVKSDQHQENDNRIEDVSHAPNTTRKTPSRSARRKKAKRQWLRAMANIGKKEGACKSEALLNWKQSQTKTDKNCQSKGLLNWKRRRAKTEKKEVICQSKGLLHWKKSRGEHNDNMVEHEQPSRDSDADNNVVPIVVRPGHIRFEPLGEDQAVDQSHVVMDTFQWNGITSKRKGQKWGTENNSPARRNYYQNFKDHSDTAAIEKEIHMNDPIDFDKLLPLSSLPKEGEVLAYQLIVLSSTWTPELSSFRVGRVLWYKPESCTIMLAPVPEHPVFLEKSDEASEQRLDNSLYREDGSLEIDFSSLIDVRVVKHSNSDSAKALNDKVTEGSTSNTDSISNLVSTNNDEKHIPSAGNGGVNLWDHFSETVNAKKAQLSEEDNWIKGSSSRSSWSYRALRGSALGPTMGLLRAKNHI